MKISGTKRGAGERKPRVEETSLWDEMERKLFPQVVEPSGTEVQSLALVRGREGKATMELGCEDDLLQEEGV